MNDIVTVNISKAFSYFKFTFIFKSFRFYIIGEFMIIIIYTYKKYFILGYKFLEVAVDNATVYVHTTAIKKWDICAGTAILRYYCIILLVGFVKYYT